MGAFLTCGDCGQRLELTSEYTPQEMGWIAESILPDTAFAPGAPLTHWICPYCRKGVIEDERKNR